MAPLQDLSYGSPVHVLMACTRQGYPADCGIDHAGTRPVNEPRADVTRILNAIEQGDPRAASQLLPLVYDELRRLAARRMDRESRGQTLTATSG